MDLKALEILILLDTCVRYPPPSSRARPTTECRGLATYQLKDLYAVLLKRPIHNLRILRASFTSHIF